MSLQLLQENIAHLSKEELDAFSKWFEEFMADQWDKEIERDILAGKFDAAGKQAIEDLHAGRCTPL
jgi:hypothetical protein